MSAQPLYGPARRGFLHGRGWFAWGVAAAGAAAMGCSVGAHAPAADRPLLTPGVVTPAPAPQPGGGAGSRTTVERPAALVGNAPITWDEMQPLMAEAAGGVVLEEIVLDRALASELAQQGVTITAEDVERERGVVLRSLGRAAGASPDGAVDLLQTLRRARGLGEHRFTALLKRNASLRRLVRDEVIIGEDELRQGYAVQHGPRYRSRLIVAPNERVAAQAIARVRGARDGGGAGNELFGEIAAALSTDDSAQRGGLIEPISPADPTYPVALRQALVALEVGQISDPIALEQGFAIVRLEEVLPASDRTFDEVRAEVEAEVRLVRERAAMDGLAGRLLRAAPVIILDRPLDWSWQGRSEQNRR